MLLFSMLSRIMRTKRQKSGFNGIISIRFCLNWSCLFQPCNCILMCWRFMNSKSETINKVLYFMKIVKQEQKGYYHWYYTWTNVDLELLSSAASNLPTIFLRALWVLTILSKHQTKTSQTFNASPASLFSLFLSAGSKKYTFLTKYK